MSVSQLIEKLQRLPADSTVRVFDSDLGELRDVDEVKVDEDEENVVAIYME